MEKEEENLTKQRTKGVEEMGSHVGALLISISAFSEVGGKDVRWMRIGVSRENFQPLTFLHQTCRVRRW